MNESAGVWRWHRTRRVDAWMERERSVYAWSVVGMGVLGHRCSQGADEEGRIVKICRLWMRSGVGSVCRSPLWRKYGLPQSSLDLGRSVGFRTPGPIRSNLVVHG